MNCSDFNKFLDDYENLNSTELDELNNHAQSCENCKSELEFFKSIMLTAASLPVPELPVDLIDKINSRIDSLPKSTICIDRVVNNFRCNTRRYAFAAACVAVGAIVGLNGKNINNMLNKTPDTVIPVAPVVDVAPVIDVASKDIGDTDIIDSDVITPQIEDAVKTSVEPVIRQEYKMTQPKKQVVTASDNRSDKNVKVTPAEVKSTETVENIVPEISARIEEKPEVTQAPVKSGLSRYTIARENYHIPTPSDNEVAMASETQAPVADNAPSERYQIAMGNYEIPEAEKKAISNKLVVREADISEIIECMHTAGIKGVPDGYEGTISEFHSFITMLDSRGINYSYAEANSEDAKVSFVLLAN